MLFFIIILLIITISIIIQDILEYNGLKRNHRENLLIYMKININNCIMKY